VEVTGTIKPDDDARPDQKPPSFQNLPNIEGTFVREASGAPCPATPAAAR
jgi:hypothetical protein